jgi:hypothetical protein
MHDHSIAFTTPPDAPRWQRWLLFSPLARIVIFGLLLVAFSFAMGWVFHATGWGGAKGPVLDHAMARCLLRAVPALLVYLLLVRLVERRPVNELALGTAAGRRQGSACRHPAVQRGGWRAVSAGELSRQWHPS